MAEITPEGRAMAVKDLERIEATLSQMSQWVDGGSPDRERCASRTCPGSSICHAACAYATLTRPGGRKAWLANLGVRQ